MWELVLTVAPLVWIVVLHPSDEPLRRLLRLIRAVRRRGCRRH
jgi:hypothetical protein